jgi:hypothetical protein
VIYAIVSEFQHGTDEQERARCDGDETQASGVRSAPAVMPEVDYRIGEGLECVVQPTEAFEAQ